MILIYNCIISRILKFFIIRHFKDSLDSQQGNCKTVFVFYLFTLFLTWYIRVNNQAFKMKFSFKIHTIITAKILACSLPCV